MQTGSEHVKDFSHASLARDTINIMTRAMESALEMLPHPIGSARLKNGDCFIGVNRFNRVKSGILDNVDGTHAQDHLVLDDKNVRHLG